MQSIELLKKELENQVSAMGHLNSDNRNLIHWFSKHLANLYAELPQIDADLYAQLMERIFPEIQARALPAHSVAQVLPQIKEQVLTIDWTGFVENTEFYFSPVLPITLYNIPIYQAYGKVLKIGTSEIPLKNGIANPKTLYIGLDISLISSHIKGLSLMFDNLRAELLDLLPFVCYECADKTPISVQKGWYVDRNESIPFPEVEFLKRERLKKAALQQYESKFYHLTLEKTVSPLNFAELDGNLPESMDNKNVFWIKASFPADFAEADLGKLQIHLNCVPVWNVKLHREHGIFRNDAMIPLLNEEGTVKNQFLSLQRVWSDRGPLLPFEIHQNQSECYSLHQGYLGGFSKGQLWYRLESLLHFLETDFTKVATNYASNLPDYDNLIPDLRKFNEVLASIQKQIAVLPRTPPLYYLRFHGMEVAQMIYINYFLTQGNAVMSVSWADELRLVSKDSDISLQTAYLLGKPVQGRDPLSLMEKENLIKQQLSDRFHNSKNYIYYG